VQGTGSKSISNQLELSFQERAASMTEPDILDRKVDELKEWQRVAWRRVADPSVTDFERREIRNHIKESDEHLRYYLGMVSRRLRLSASHDECRSCGGICGYFQNKVP
jgi:hypothetical protein